MISMFIRYLNDCFDSIIVAICNVATACPLLLSEPADGSVISAAGTGFGDWPQATIRG
jgi:hypothetical protein